MNRRLQTGGHLTPARAQLSLRRGFARSPLGGRRGRALIGSWSQLTSEIGGVSMNRTLTRPGGHPLPSDGRGAGVEGPLLLSASMAHPSNAPLALFEATGAVTRFGGWVR